MLSIIVLFTSSLELLRPNKAEATSSRCLLTIEWIENHVNSIERLMSSYKQSIAFSQDPLHKEFRDDHLRHAQSYLDMLANEFENIAIRLTHLVGCEDISKEGFSKLAKHLNRLIQIGNGSFFSENNRLHANQYGNLFAKVMLNIKNLEATPGLEKLYVELFPEGSANKEGLTLFTENLLSGLHEYFYYRMPALDSNASITNNLAVAADGISILSGQIKNLISNYKGTASEVSTSNKIKNALKLTAFKEIIGSVQSMGMRSLYMTAIQKGVTNKYISADQQDFGDNFAGNMASFLVATDPISMGLAYNELVGDMSDYINEHLKIVNAQLDKNAADYAKLLAQQKSAQRNIQHASSMLSAANSFAEKTSSYMYDQSLSAEQYAQLFYEQFIQLEKEIYGIYKLDPKEIKIYVNGEKLESNVKPFITGGTTMVPLRLIAEAVNVTPVWNNKNRTITITTDRTVVFRGKMTEIIFTVGSKNVKYGPYYTSVESAPVVKSGTTFVPLRFIAQELGLKVTWIGESNSIVLSR